MLVLSDQSALVSSTIIAIAVTGLTVLFAVRRVRGTDAEGVAGRRGRFPRHRATRRATVLVSTLAALFAGLIASLSTDRKGSDALAAASSAQATSQWVWVVIILGVLALVAALVVALRSRDGRR